MDVILFLREIRKKGKKYKDIWLEILMQYDGQNTNIKLNVPIGMPPSTFHRIIIYGVELFPNHINSCSLTKNKMTLNIVCNEIKTVSKKETTPVVKKTRPKNKPEIKQEEEKSTVIESKPLLMLIPEISPEIVKPIKNKRIKKQVEVLPVHIEIISYLNECAGTKYQTDTKSTIDLINGLLVRNFTIENFKHVIEVKSIKWLNTDYQDYLRPETLFGKKFESYLNEKKLINNQKQHKAYESVSEATDIGWNTQ